MEPRQWESTLDDICEGYAGKNPQKSIYQTSKLKSFIHTIEDKARHEAIAEVKQIVVDTDAPYTTECCRKTANHYKHQTLSTLENKKHE